MKEVEVICCIDVDGTNGNNLHGIHSEEYEESNELGSESVLTVASQAKQSCKQQRKTSSRQLA